MAPTNTYIQRTTIHKQFTKNVTQQHSPGTDGLMAMARWPHVGVWLGWCANTYLVREMVVTSCLFPPSPSRGARGEPIFSTLCEYLSAAQVFLPSLMTFTAAHCNTLYGGVKALHTAFCINGTNTEWMSIVFRPFKPAAVVVTTTD